MKQKEKIKEFEKLYSKKILELDENLMPIIRDPITTTPELCKKKILKFPECRIALAIMIEEFGGLYFPTEKQIKEKNRNST